MSEGLVGMPIPRVEDERFLTGRGRFVDDFEPGAAQAAFVRSPHAHARILGVRTDRARSMDGVLAVFVHADLDEGLRGPLPVLVPNPGLTAPRTQSPLPAEEVCYAGQVVAMVVARDRYLAEDAAATVEVEYEYLPSVSEVERAAASGAPRVHLNLEGNLAGRVAEEVGDVEAGLAAAPRTFAWRFRIERSAGMPLEGRAVLARWDPVDESLLVYDSTQSPAGIRAGLAAMFGLDPDRVHVVAPDVGGGFGTKAMQFYAEEVLVPWAARRLGVPVKWVEDRRESFHGSNHERTQVHDVRVGTDEEGRIVALETRFLHDMGAFCPYGLVLPVITASTLPGPYRLPAYRYEYRAVYTNALPTSPYRGAGRAEAAFVMERVVQRVARALGRDPVEVRRRNLIPPEEMPYRVGVTFQDGGPTVYDSGDYPRALDLLLEAARYPDLMAERDRAQAEGRWFGVGIGCYVEGSGLGPYEGAAVRVLSDGTVTVAVSLSTQGQGHETAFAQIAADELDLPVDRVRVVTGDTRRMGFGVGTIASRSAVTGGNAVLLACRALRARIEEVAARFLEVDPGDVEVGGGEARARGEPDRSIPLGQLALLANPLRFSFGSQAGAVAELSQRVRARGGRPLPEGSAPGLAAVEFFSPESPTFGYGMHAAAVEVDPDTLDLTIHRYVVVHDCGHMLNPAIVEGQLTGAVAQGIGGSFYERIAYGEDGTIQNANLMDFLIPSATEVPRVELHHLETPSPHNPLGVKGVAEAGTVPVAATIANALEDALDRPVDSMPVFPHDLLDLLGEEA